MRTMHEEIIASSELYDSFPRYKMSDYNTRYSNGSIPIIVVPPSKYSSTETDCSSDDDDYYYDGSGGGNNGRDNGRRLTVSGFSTSASSSGSAKRRRRIRRRRKGTSSSGSTTGVGGMSSSLTLSIKSNMSGLSQRSSLISSQGISKYNSTSSGSKGRNYGVPVLNSINDLNHAIGRHRGISGSFTPSIDCTLFAMFYATDIFDGLLKDELSPSLISTKYDNGNSSSLRKDVKAILRKEIVYSLRTSYFCPASKIVKLAQLLEENFPLEKIHEPASFLDLLLSKILTTSHHPPFLTYSNGSARQIHRLPLEERSHLKRSHFQPTVLTIQQLLQRNFEGHSGNGSSWKRGKYGVGEGSTKPKFVTVPYPALILQVVRKSLTSYNTNHPTWTSRPNFPIIPNMELDLTGFMSKANGSSGTNTVMYRQIDDYHHNDHHPERFLQSFSSCLDESLTSYYPPSSETSFSGETDDVRRGRVGVVVESRIMKGLKSAAKIMFKYLENFTSSSSDFTAQHPDSLITSSNSNNSNNSYYADGAATSNSTFSLKTNNNDRHNSSDYNLHLHGQINHPRSSLLPSTAASTSFQTYDYDDSSHYYHHPHAKNELEGSFTLSGNSQQQQQEQQKQPEVKMELIAVVCYAGADGGNKLGLSNNKTVTGTSPYFVYCKAGKDYKRRQSHGNGVNGYHRDTEEWAPWILYQSRYGVAPQVTLIENFGKWISSLEKNHEEFSLYEVPLEIRRVLENSHLLIYKRIL